MAALASLTLGIDRGTSIGSENALTNKRAGDALGHLENGFILEFRSVLLIAHGAAPSDSILTSELSTFPGKVQRPLPARARTTYVWRHCDDPEQRTSMCRVAMATQDATTILLAARHAPSHIAATKCLQHPRESSQVGFVHQVGAM